MTRHFALVATFFVAVAATAPGQERITGANYPLAQKFNKDFVAQHVQESSVAPQWIGKTDVVLVRRAHRDRHAVLEGRSGRQGEDAAVRSRRPRGRAVGSRQEAARSRHASHRPRHRLRRRQEADLRLRRQPLRVRPRREQAQVARQGAGQQWAALGRSDRTDCAASSATNGSTKCSAGSATMASSRNRTTPRRTTWAARARPSPRPGGGARTPTRTTPPTRRTTSTSYKFNLYLCDEGQPEEKATQLSKDGGEDYTFASGLAAGSAAAARDSVRAMARAERWERRQPATARPAPNVTWSPDSKAFYITRTDSRGVKDLYLVDSIATPAAEARTVQVPHARRGGGPQVRALFLRRGEANAHQGRRRSGRTNATPTCTGARARGELRFIRRDRLQRNLEVCSLDVLHRRVQVPDRRGVRGRLPRHAAAALRRGKRTR